MKAFTTTWSICGERYYLADEVDGVLQDVKALLEEISLGRGAFNLDPLTHAGNCIESMKADAIKGLLVLEGGFQLEEGEA